MSRVIVEVSPSIDGYVAGPGVGVDEPFGTAGLRLHRWMGFGGGSPAPSDRAAADAAFATAGAVVIGRRMFDVGVGPWGDDGAFKLPTYVVTHRPQDTLIKGPTTFTFVTDGVSRAVELARASADGRDVVVAGGANVIQQCLAAGLVDELRLHLVPVLLGGGTALFAAGAGTGCELTLRESVPTPLATHAAYGVVR